MTLNSPFKSNLKLEELESFGSPLLFHHLFNSSYSANNIQLSSRFYAPRVAAKLQFYNDLPSVCDSPVWAVLNDTNYCSLNSLLVALDLSYSIPLTPLSFDHVFIKYSSSSVVSHSVILYADIHHSSFKDFYYPLYNSIHNLFLILRYIPSSLDSTLVLSGYGVELAVKNTEYKVVDDRDDGISQEDSTQLLFDSIIPDFEFDVSLPSIQKVVNVETIGLKFKRYLLSKDDPLKYLEYIVQNFPRYNYFISNLDNLTSSEYHVMKSAFFKNNKLIDKDTNLWINGYEIDTTRFDYYKLIRFLKSEQELFTSLEKLDVSFNDTRRLLIGDDSIGLLN